MLWICTYGTLTLLQHLSKPPTACREQELVAVCFATIWRHDRQVREQLLIEKAAEALVKDFAAVAINEGLQEGTTCYSGRVNGTRALQTEAVHMLNHMS